jgi:hypothetical protein
MTTSTSFPAKPFFLAGLPAFFVLHGYLEYHGLVSAKDALLLFGKYELLALLLWGLATLLLRSAAKGALLAFVLLLIQFFFGSAQDALKGAPSTAFLSRYVVLLPFLLLFTILIFFRLKRRNMPARLPAFINFLLALLLMIDVVSLAFRPSANAAQLPGKADLHFQKTATAKPDIYVFVADEYAGAQQLHDVLAFNNGSFYDSLRARGFRVLKDTRSNYNLTEYSTASLLNMDTLPVAAATNPRDVARCLSWIRNNRTEHFLSGKGYSIFHFSPFGSRYSTVIIPDIFHTHSTDLLTAQTLSARAFQDLGYHLYKRGWLHRPTHRDDNRQVNETLLAATYRAIDSSGTKPRFVYSHLLLPHFPFYYDSAGRNNSPAEVASRSDRKVYLGYLQYANRVYLRLFDHLLQKSRKPPVILFLSDHGFRGIRQDSAYNFMNIAAVYAPAGQAQQWPDSTESVNQLRILLNACLGQKLSMLRAGQRYITD